MAGMDSWRLWFAAPAALALLLIACGGGSDAPDATPTPSATETPRGFLPTATPGASPTLVGAGEIFFGQPEGRLQWDGSDDRVFSTSFSHCSKEALIRDFGLPGGIDVEGELGFWLTGIVPRSSAWAWTGYYHDDWRIMQGEDPKLLYLVIEDNTRVAFEYESFGCR
jgi:hypothetical protein